MRRTIQMGVLMLCLCCIGTSAVAQTTDKTDSLNVQTADGLKQFAIDDIQKITFGNDAMKVVENNGAETEYAYTDLTTLTFYLVEEEEVVDGISQAVATATVCKPSATAVFYDLAGARVRDIKKGVVYIVRDGDKTYKTIAR